MARTIRLRSRRHLTLLSCALVLLFPAVTTRASGLGASYDAAGGVTFSVYPATATWVEVWIYAQPQNDPEKLALPMINNPTTYVWSLLVSAADLRSAGLTGSVFYGYRAWGPNWPYVASWRKGSTDGFVADVDNLGNRFNPNKLLIDPYAQEVSHNPRNPAQPNGSVYLSGAANRVTDTGGPGPKGVVLRPDPTDFGTKPARTLKDEIIYEVHPRGLTANDTTIAPGLRGTYAGAALRAADLKAMGITAVEFLPIYEHQDDANDLIPGSAANDNYWGYDPLNFFAPDRRYSSDKRWGGPTREFKSMVRAFHNAGIKVFLDVVYNHTGEGDVDRLTASTAPVLSWRGLDNPTYYELRDDDAPYEPNGRPTIWRPNGYYANNTGAGPITTPPIPWRATS